MASHKVSLLATPPPYFRLRSNGHVHLVAQIQLVVYRREAHRSIRYRCGGIANEERGVLSHTLPEGAEVCRGCEARRSRVLVRPRVWREDPAAGAIIFDLLEEAGGEP